MTPKYSTVDEPKDIAKINKMIQAKVKTTKSEAKLEDLRKESAYLLTLINSPAWAKTVRGKKKSFVNIAKSQYTMTARAINRKLKSIGSKKVVDTKLN